MKNPYTKTFGKEPPENIPRSDIIDKICDEFESENPESPIYILTGIRGCGKTVTMTGLVSEIRQDSSWICVEINSSSDDMLKSMAAQLYSQKSVFTIISRAKINLSVLGLGIEYQGEPPVTDYATAVSRILEQLKKAGKKVLVTLDEIIVSRAAKEFIKQFQIYIRNDLPIFMVVTGIYRSVEEISNAQGMTFLYRAPRIPVEPLDKIAVANSYEKQLGVSRTCAIDMARLSRGYSFGFQVLGYLCFETGKPYTEILQQFDHEMYEKVYRKVWTETSRKEKEVMNAVACAGSSRVKAIRAVLHMETNQFNPVRRRLIDQGIVVSESDGYLSFALPRFPEFVREMYLLDM